MGILACSEFLGVGPVLSLFAARTPAGTDRQDAFAFDQEPAVGFGLGLPPETFLRDKKMDDRTFFCRAYFRYLWRKASRKDFRLLRSAS